jgi:hypothetical protein
MYPIEMGKIFGWWDTTQMHASETVSGDIIETAWETDDTTEENDTTEIWIENPIDTTWNQENNSFWELNDLETTTNTDTITEDTNLSKLADYVNKGNTLRDQGKTINNTTIIKYWLYISKKATDLLEKIAKGEEISNMDWYFAQFDKYILQLEWLLGTTQNQEISSSEVQAYETTEQNTVPEPTTNSFTTE